MMDAEWAEAIDRTDGVELKGKAMWMLPQARLYMARTLIYLIEDQEISGSLLFTKYGRRTCSLVRRHLGMEIDNEGDKDFTTVLEALEQLAAHAEQELAEAESDDVSTQLGDHLADALSMSPAEALLLRLALHAFHSPDLRCAIDLAGECDDGGVSTLFAGILGLEFSEVFDALSTHSPLRALSRAEASSGHCWPTRFLAFPDHLTKILRRKSSTAGDVLACFFRLSPEPKLDMADFSGMSEEIPLLCRYLSRAVVSGRAGVNILS